jgi:hypothetical protein
MLLILLNLIFDNLSFGFTFRFFLVVFLDMRIGQRALFAVELRFILKEKQVMILDGSKSGSFEGFII